MTEPETKIKSYNPENYRPVLWPVLLELARLFRSKATNKHTTEMPCGSEIRIAYVVYAQRVITFEIMYEARYVCKFCACL